MDNTENHFKKFSDLADLARGFIEFPIGGPGPSLPVPAHRQGRLQVAFMIYSKMVMPGPLQMWPPDKVGWLDPVTGKRLALIKVLPADFGQKDSADEMMEVTPYRFENMTPDEFRILKKRLFELYDILFTAWAAKPFPTGQSRLQNQARDFLRIFHQFSEPPLRPYYEALGRDWFGWLRALAQ